jgi:hypothetical protein
MSVWQTILEEVDQRIAKAFAQRGFTGLTLDAGTIGGALPPSVLPDLAGDAEGPPGANVVTAIQGIPVSATDPTMDQVLAFDGSEYVPVDPATGGGGLIVEEIDGTPSGAPTTLQFPNGTVSDEGSGVYRYAPAVGGGGGMIYTSAYASPPGSPADGDWWYPSDSVGLYAARISSAWVWYFRGYPVTLPPASGSWTWVNQGTSTVTDVGGGLHLITQAGSNAQNYRCLVTTAPSTPWTVTVDVLPFLWEPTADTGQDGVVLICRESGTGKIQGILWSWNSLYHQQMTNATTHSSNPSSSGGWPYAQPVWLQLSDNGTNIISRVSNDGYHWHQIYSQGRTAFMAGGPNQIGWAINGYNPGQGEATLVHWVVT